jgi:hypothetical protein
MKNEQNFVWNNLDAKQQHMGNLGVMWDNIETNISEISVKMRSG